MIRHVGYLFAATFILACTGCLVPSSRNPSVATVTIRNTTDSTIIATATEVFTTKGYRVARRNVEGDVAFDKPARGMNRLMWGSYMNTTDMRVALHINPTPDKANTYTVFPRVFVVRDRDMPGFTDTQKLMDVWTFELRSVMAEIQKRAENTL